MRRGEVRWYTFRVPDKRRPVLILTRNEVIDHLNEIIVVPATRTVRGLTTEVLLTADDGQCTIRPVDKSHSGDLHPTMEFLIGRYRNLAHAGSARIVKHDHLNRDGRNIPCVVIEYAGDGSTSSVIWCYSSAPMAGH